MPEMQPAGERTLDAYAAQPIQLAGVKLLADRSGTLYVPDAKALIVADLHLEKGSASAARGRMLPPYDTRETLARLAAVIERAKPQTVIALGDSLHDPGAAQRIDPADSALLGALQAGRSWIWVRGNHDPEIAASFGGSVVCELRLLGLTLRHAPSLGPGAGEIAGHLHPAARISARGQSLRRRCFVGDSQRLVMPAFGAFTGGLNVLDKAFAPLFDAGMPAQVLMLGDAGIYPIAPDRLLAD